MKITATEAVNTTRKALRQHWGNDCDTDFLELYVNDPMGHGRRSVIYSALTLTMMDPAAVEATIAAIPTVEG